MSNIPPAQEDFNTPQAEEEMEIPNPAPLYPPLPQMQFQQVYIPTAKAQKLSPVVLAMGIPLILASPLIVLATQKAEVVRTMFDMGRLTYLMFRGESGAAHYVCYYAGPGGYGPTVLKNFLKFAVQTTAAVSLTSGLVVKSAGIDPIPPIRTAITKVCAGLNTADMLLLEVCTGLAGSALAAWYWRKSDIPCINLIACGLSAPYVIPMLHGACLGLLEGCGNVGKALRNTFTFNSSSYQGAAPKFY